MKLKRFLTALLGALLILSSGIPAFAADAGSPGPAADTAGAVTRGEFLSAVCDLSGASALGTQDAFADVPENGEFAGIVRWAVENGIVNGYGDGRFDPDAPVTREQAALMLYRYAKTLGKGFTGLWSFRLDAPDAAEISGYASEAVHWAVMNGIFADAEEGIRPKEALMQWELVPLLSRVPKALGLESVWYSFKDITLAIKMGTDILAKPLGEEIADIKFIGESRRIYVHCGLWDRLDAANVNDLLDLAAESTMEETEVFDRIGLRAVKVLFRDGTFGYFFIAPDGDIYHLTMGVDADSDPELITILEKKVLTPMEDSICHYLDIPEGEPVITVSTRMNDPDYLVLVNKQNKLPENWADNIDLVWMENSLGDTVDVEREAYKAYLFLREDLAAHGILVDLDSAYRSVEAQEEIMNRFTEEYGADYAAKTVAKPGYSEHHTGLALDLYLNIDLKDVYYNEDMMKYPEVWEKIHEKLADYGFILRYPENVEHITGYGYEPWHIRYVGSPEAAHEIADSGLTFEGWLGAVNETAVEVEYGTSELFTEEELKEAAVQIKCSFAFWTGCELHSLRYAGDGTCTEENVKWANEINPAGKYTEVIGFTGDFHSPLEAYGAWEADTEYTDYTWWLGRNADGGWDLFSSGY